jgi:hypothetical protein
VQVTYDLVIELALRKIVAVSCDVDIPLLAGDNIVLLVLVVTCNNES